MELIQLRLVYAWLHKFSIRLCTRHKIRDILFLLQRHRSQQRISVLVYSEETCFMSLVPHAADSPSSPPSGCYIWPSFALMQVFCLFFSVCQITIVSIYWLHLVCQGFWKHWPTESQMYSLAKWIHCFSKLYSFYDHAERHVARVLQNVTCPRSEAGTQIL